jgi:cytochrome o ubiquinol oxidase subunit 1
MKQAGTAYLRPASYEAIVLPRNSAAGFVMGGIAFGFGFAVIWHIWWAAIAAALGMLAVVIVRTWGDDQDYTLPAAEVERLEDARFASLESAPEAALENGHTLDNQRLFQV